MAKRVRKVLPARKPVRTRDDDSLLMRSAESLGRVVGSLQRQMQGTTERMATIAKDARNALPELPSLGTGALTGSRKKAGTRKKAARKRGTTRKRAGASTTSGSRRAASRRLTPARARKMSARSK